MSSRWDRPLGFLLGGLLLVLAGCGGGGGQVAVDTSAPPLDFAFAPAAEPMEFAVDLSSEGEFRGTSVVSSVRFHWTARDWRAEGDSAWTAEVTFHDVKAAMRRGSSISMEPIAAFERLEGYSLRYRKDAAGFAPLSEPAEDREFLGLFSQLQFGLGPLDMEIPAEPVRPGERWTEIISPQDMEQLAGALQDSVITRRYLRDEMQAGRDCARLETAGEFPLDGIIEQGDERVRLEGKIEFSGTSWLDLERGFAIKESSRMKQFIDQHQVDERGNPAGQEFSIVQTVNVDVRYLDG